MTIPRDMLENFALACRIALFIAGVTIGMIFLLAGTKAALAASLRTETVIAGDYIRLGDIFEGVKNADYILGPAPQPGKDMVLNARTLYKIASALDVEWTPSSSMDQIVLKRDAVIIPETDIEKALQEKILETGMDEKFTMRFSSPLSPITLPANEDDTLEITGFSFDPQKDQFNAVIVAPSASNPLKRMTLVGSIERLVAVPVLKNTLKNGDIIGAMDIEYLELAQSKIPSGALLDETALVSMTPRRVAHSGKPILSNELEHPKMVDRGDNITLIFETGPMTLTIKGKSLQSGALGDTVRVSNIDSNKNLQGVVTAHREVTIR
jgi:flagellar basal body P-ring formation protein FlgA